MCKDTNTHGSLDLMLTTLFDHSSRQEGRRDMGTRP